MERKEKKKKPGNDGLRHGFVDDDVIGAMIGADVLDLDRGALARPLFARRGRTERQSGQVGQFAPVAQGGVAVVVGRPAGVQTHHVAQYEGGHVGRLPEGGVQQMRQRRRRERRQPFRTVEDVVQPLAAPPALRHCPVQ